MPALVHDHPWKVAPREAIAIQKQLAAFVEERPLPALPQTIAGVDVSVRGDRVQTAIVVLTLPHFKVVDQVVYQDDVAFPYVPGLLSFREMPAILPALDQLQIWPDVFMTDSQGRAHPRRFGLACHLGVLLGHPTFGVAKSRLTGRFEMPDVEKSATSPLMDREEQIGTVVRTRTNILPVYVSVGHAITLDEAVGLTLACALRYKIPEPTRLAHRLSKNGTL
ncbi:MAG: deoxyribonuclease V [Rhodothermales bacterium]